MNEEILGKRLYLSGNTNHVQVAPDAVLLQCMELCIMNMAFCLGLFSLPGRLCLILF